MQIGWVSTSSAAYDLSQAQTRRLSRITIFQ